MPPKKGASAAKGDGGDDKTFRWTPENDRKLLLLTFGRPLTTDDYHQIVTAMPGSNYNGVRIRVSKLRIEQRKMFEDLGWSLPTENTPRKAAAPASGKAKRPAKDALDDDGDLDAEKSDNAGGGLSPMPTFTAVNKPKPSSRKRAKKEPSEEAAEDNDDNFYTSSIKKETDYGSGDGDE